MVVFGFGSTTPDAASTDATMRAINDACRRRGGAYGGYSCKVVSWDDASRGNSAFGGLSTVGPNITDTYLKAKDGTPLFTVRPDNWNEKLGSASASGIAVISGNHARGGQGALAPITLKDFLKRAGELGGYAGLPPGLDLSDDTLDAKVSVRFQTTFLPVKPAGFATTFREAHRETLEFATEAYNYQTRSDDDPKNLVLLCTTQGLAVQADGAQATRIFHHRVQGNGKVHRHWLEAERTSHQVGGPQTETAAERADAIARGKATSCVIGPECVGTRFNVLMTIQVPLKQQAPQGGGLFGAPMGMGGGMMGDGMGGGMAKIGGGMGGGGFGAPPNAMTFGSPQQYGGGAAFGGAPPPPAPIPAAGGAPPPPAAFGAPVAAFGASAFGAEAAASAAVPPPTGVSNAARVSYGSQHDEWPGLAGRLRAPGVASRHASEHITATVVLYNVVVGGVPSEADVVAAIDDLERLYAACRADARAEQPVFNATTGFPTPTTINPFTNPPTTNPFTNPPPPDVSDAAAFPTPQPPALAFGASPFAPFAGAPAPLLQQASQLPRTDAAFRHLHDLALARLSPPLATRTQLAEALSLFRLAGELQTQLEGAPSSLAMYNSACCLSRLAAVADNPLQVPPAAGLGPGSALELSKEQCLNAAVGWLRAAAACGYTDFNHMKTDTDLACVREQRATFFATAVKIAEATAGGS